MFFFIKFIGYFIVSFVILCVPIDKEPLFAHLYEMTQPLFQSVKKEAIKGIHQGKKIGKQYFLNLPPKEIFQDKIRSTRSSAISLSFDDDEVSGSMTVQERALLEKILREQK